MNQITDIRLKKKRSEILKDFCKTVEGSDLEKANQTYELAKQAYKFLQAYFSWEGTIDRQIYLLNLGSDDRHYADLKK